MQLKMKKFHFEIKFALSEYFLVRYYSNKQVP